MGNKVTQAGSWTEPAGAAVTGQDAPRGDGHPATKFQTMTNVGLTPCMAGWLLQPDINVPVYALITEVDGEAGTITVEGDYVSLGTTDTRFRFPRNSPLDCSCGSLPAATAPPGTENWGPLSGTLQDPWVSAR